MKMTKTCKRRSKKISLKKNGQGCSSKWTLWVNAPARHAIDTRIAFVSLSIDCLSSTGVGITTTAAALFFWGDMAALEWNLRANVAGSERR